MRDRQGTRVAPLLLVWSPAGKAQERESVSGCSPWRGTEGPFMRHPRTKPRRHALLALLLLAEPGGLQQPVQAS